VPQTEDDATHASAYHQCVLNTKIKSVDLFLQQRKLEGESDLALLVKAVAVFLKIQVDKKTDTEYFDHPEHKIIRAFAMPLNTSEMRRLPLHSKDFR